MLRFHNTLTNKIEDFQPINDNEVKMYICGPTVWNFAHIGNFRTFTFGDILTRYLRFKGYKVTHVMNLTDVDDRIINESVKASKTIDEFVQPYIVAFWEDMDVLGNLRPDYAPRATEHIAEMISIIQTLLENGKAYESDGSIYFRISAFPEYGKLSKIKFEGNIVGGSERIDTDKYEKEDARDFALWKIVDKSEPTGWDAPFGYGRPGWHIECSAMSMKYLGDTFDIHAGGIDLQFPHHENEIAQSEGATGKLFSKYWLHGEFLKVDSEKMSKSLGNDFTLRDIINRGFNPLAIRYLLISVPYNKQLNFTFEGLKGAETTVERLQQFRRLVSEANTENGSNAEVKAFVEKSLREFEEALDDDLNTSVALAAIHNLVREINTVLARSELKSDDRKAVLEAIEKFDSVFGIFGKQESEILDAEIEQLIEERQEARRNRNFNESDDIRNFLLSDGVVLEDTKEGIRWKRITENTDAERRIRILLNHFSGQTVSGELFGVNKQITLPKFRNVEFEPKIFHKRIDFVAESENENWFIEVKVVHNSKIASSRILEQMKNYLNLTSHKVGNKIIWLAVIGDLPESFKEALSILGIYYSTTSEIEKLEKILKI